MSILDKIIKVKKEEVSRIKSNFTISRFSDSELFEQPTIKFNTTVNNSNGIGIIAEIKKASPSKGIIRNEFNHMDIAKTYLNNNVNAISVLTDKQFFQGDIKYLNDIAYIKSVPLLRKDFIIDEFQQQALVEQFIRGREFCVGLLGNDNLEAFPFLEIDLEVDPEAIGVFAVLSGLLIYDYADLTGLIF